MSIKIIYSDISPDAKADSTPSAERVQDFVKPDDLKSENTVGNYATVETDRWLLDGSFGGFPDDTVSAKLGIWGKYLSGEDGAFSDGQTPTLTRVFSGKHKTIGVTFTFDTHCGDYCRSLNVKWYNDSTLAADRDYEPNSTIYFCEQSVAAFNKMVVTFRAMNKKDRYLKLFAVDDGAIRVFEGRELESVQLLEGISPISEDLSINTLDFSLCSKDNTAFAFQKKQPFKVYRNDKLMGCFFTETAKRMSERKYDVSAEDYIGLLDKMRFRGGLYDTDAAAVLAEIMGDIPYSAESDLQSVSVKGYIPVCTRREALGQLLFVIGRAADTSRSDKVEIKKLSGDTHVIDKKNIFQGESCEIGDIYTKVEVTEHSYTLTAEQTELYNEALSGETTVYFSAPHGSLTVTGGSIKESGVNFAVLTGTGATVVLRGCEYKDTASVKTKTNPDVLSGTAENCVRVDNAGLINKDNSEEILNRVYSHYMANRTIGTKLVLANGERTGDRVKYPTAYDGDVYARIIGLDLSLYNKLIGQAVIKLE